MPSFPATMSGEGQCRRNPLDAPGRPDGVFAFISVPLFPIAQVAVVLLRRGVGMWLALLPIAPMVRPSWSYGTMRNRAATLPPSCSSSPHPSPSAGFS